MSTWNREEEFGMAIPGQQTKIKSTILIVDDDPGVRYLLKQLLAYDDYQIISASDGIEALEKAIELQPDVVLSDVLMPGMNGFELCRQLRTDPILAEVPIILITVLDDYDSYLEGLKAGADDFITKPFDPLKLRARVSSVARLNRYRRLLEERAKFERLIELSPDGVLLIGGDGTIQMANPTIVRMLQMDEGDRPDREKSELVCPWPSFERLHQVLRSGGCQSRQNLSNGNKLHADG